IPRRIDEVHVGDYLISLFDDTAITFYRDIRRLPPSHSLTATPDGIALRRYASLDSDREIRLGSNDEYAEAFREIFVAAVRCRTRSIHPVAAALSGGLDSSSVVCVAREILSGEGRGPLRTYSVVFDAMAQCDERRHISAVLEGGGIEPHSILADEVSPLVDLERLLHHVDEPFFAPNLFLHWELYRGAQAAGAHVFLDGLDGDTTVSHGLAYLMELARKGRWLKMNRELTLLTKGYVRIKKSDLLRRAVLNPLLIRPLRKRWFAMRGKSATPWGSDTAIDEGFARRIGLADRFEALGRGEQRAPGTLREEHRQRLEWGAHPFLLEVTDRSAWAFGVEPRYPFFDRRLIEFCLALPPDQKLSGGWTRMVLRRGMEGILPKQIQWRVDKSDLGPNFFRGLALHEGDRLERLLAAEPNPLVGYADLPRLRDIMTRYRQHRAGDGEVLALWKAITLALWLNRESGIR
ncbi:MAG: asparagine synthase-related protein, partial [Bacteroidota bacterium]